jgi:L-ascorbate metabolism protein UlaG (beta-lactamase superfamily)
MRRSSLLLMSLAAVGHLGALTPEEAVRRITWYGQNTLRIQLAGKVIWIDPASGPRTEVADLILVTHNHGDHYSVSGVAKLRGPSTVVITSFEAQGAQRMRPGDRRELGALTVEAVPAYNIRKPTHPKNAGFCGYIISGEDVRIYVAGDTERIPEMQTFTADIALLPLGQTYTMVSVGDAVASALDVKAKIAIPVHFGMYEGTQEDADKFVADLKAKGVQALQLARER